MAERTIELDEPVLDEQSQALQNAVERAERAEAELAKLKSKAPGHGAAQTSESAERPPQHAHAAEPDKEPAVGETGELNFAATDVEEEDGEPDDAPVTRGKATAQADEDEDEDTPLAKAEKVAPRTTSSTARPDPSGKHFVEPGSMDRSKQPAAQEPEGHPVGELQVHGIEALREDSMMAHLLDALDRGEDIGHYGRLTFAMIARHFLSDDEVMAELTKDRDFGEEEARQMLVQVEGRDYSPPRRERILEWQAEQDFAIIPNAHDPDCGNVYKSLRFSKQTYSHIGHYQEEKAAS